MFTTSNHIGESHGFYDVKFDHVTSYNTMLLMELNDELHFSSLRL